uniref:(northern house mosquito) hypothetical protein n=1 Tax=Culex pipiens TaxID=7175 RepID=A0A8D8AV87_CULPI
MLTPPATTSGCFFSSGDVTLGDPSSSEATAIRRSFCRIERSKRRRNRIWFPMARRRPILLCGRPVLLLLLSSTVTLGRIWLDTSRTRKRTLTTQPLEGVCASVCDSQLAARETSLCYCFFFYVHM